MTIQAVDNDSLRHWPRHISVAATVVWLLFAIAHGALGRTLATAIELTAFVLNAVLLFIAYRRDPEWSIRAILVVNLPALAAITAISGGVHSLAIWWIPLLAMSAAMVLDRIESLAWGFFTIAVTSIAAWLADTEWAPQTFAPSTLELILGQTGLTVALLALPWLYRRELVTIRTREERQHHELLRSFEQISALQQDLEDSRTEQQRLLQMIHHSLRTSTTAAAGAMDLLASMDIPLPEREQELLDIACRQTALLRDQIRDLLDARELIATDREAMAQQPTDLVRLVRRQLVDSGPIHGAVITTASEVPDVLTDPDAVVVALRILMPKHHHREEPHPASIDVVIGPGGRDTVCLWLPPFPNDSGEPPDYRRFCNRIAITLLRIAGATVVQGEDEDSIREIRFRAAS